MSATTRRARMACLALILLGTLGPLHADRLVLENGGSIETSRWWYDGDWVRYESVGGTIAVPRSMVIRVQSESSGTADGTGNASDNGGPTKPARRTKAKRTELKQWMREGSEALSKREFQTASNQFFAVVQDAPEITDARVGYAIAELALGRYSLAQSVLLDGLERDPSRAELHELLGDLHDREERVDEALLSWREAFRIAPTDPLRTKIFKGEREQQASSNYDFSASSHFTVRYDGSVDLTLAAAVMDYLEEQYWTLSDQFAHAPLQPITVLLYPTREFREVTQTPEWVGGLYDGKIRVPLGGLNRLDPRAKHVLTHELTHAVVHDKTRGNCPRWLHEGLAQRSEGKRTSTADLPGLTRELSGVSVESWEAEAFSYPLALSLTDYLESRRGFSDVIVLLDKLGEGMKLDQALREVYGRDYATLARQWSETLRREGER